MIFMWTRKVNRSKLLKFRLKEPIKGNFECNKNEIEENTQKFYIKILILKFNRKKFFELIWIGGWFQFLYRSIYMKITPALIVS